VREGGREKAATVTPKEMRLVAATSPDTQEPTEIETVHLTHAQLEFLGQLSTGLNPAMPVAFGAPHVLRTLLEKLEDAEERRGRQT
jgi:hypothetical protein